MSDGSATGPDDLTAPIEVTGLSSRGAGVARLPDGRAVFVHGTVPGDEVRVRVTTSRKSWARGVVGERTRSGPDRRDPPCAHAGRCGGCPLEHLMYSAQLSAKRTRIADALERIGGLDAIPEIEVHPSPREFRYRNRASFSLRRLGGERVVAGFHELDRPGRIVDLGGECMLLEPALAALWDDLREHWGSGASRLPRGKALRLTLRVVEGGDGLLLIEGDGDGRGADGGNLEALLDRVPRLRSIWVAAGPGEPPVHRAGVEGLEEHWFGETVRIGPGTFLQVNRQAATLLHELVLREIGRPRDRRMVDAYCGIGTYGRRLARHGAQVAGIELDPGAAALNRRDSVDGFEFLEGRVEEHLDEQLPADLVILNPPRSGVDERVTAALTARPPARLIYVSCDPATLARDLARLGGVLDPVRVQAVDLFPQTPHIECVVTLNKTSPRSN